MWYPMITKPNDKSWREWVEKLVNMKAVSEHLNRFLGWKLSSKKYLYQELIEWHDIRVLYFNWEIIACYSRLPFKLSWNVFSSIWELVHNKVSYNKFLYNEIIMQLDKLWYWLDWVLWKWEDVVPLPVVNVKKWWTVQEIPYSEKDFIFINNIAKIFWAVYFGIDIISKWSICEWTVIEINSAPSISGIEKLIPWLRDNLIKKIFEYMKKEYF